MDAGVWCRSMQSLGSGICWCLRDRRVVNTYVLLFLCFFAVVACSLSTLRFSFPTLTPAVWLNQSDRLWAPGESLSLHSPLSPQLYALCDKLILASFRKAALSVGQRSAVSSHSSIHAKTKCTGEACMHSQVHAGHANKIIWEDTNTQGEKEDARYPPSTSIMPHTPLPLTANTHTHTPTPLILKVGSEKGFHV